MVRVLSLGSGRPGRDAIAVAVAVGLAAACGDDSVVRRNPNPATDGAAPGGKAGADSGVGGAESGGGGATNGGRNSTGGRPSTGGGTSVTPCTNSLDCASNQVCDRAAGYCVECVSDTDCTGASLRCVGQHCRMPCASDRQCTPQGLLCNVPLGVCTQCTADTDCRAPETCQAGNCVGSMPGTGGAGGAGGVSNGGAGGIANGGAGGVANGGAGGVSSGGAGGLLGTGGAGPLCNRADLWIALDQSGSMGDVFDTGTRWEAFRGGVLGFATTTTRAAAGIVMFPKTAAGAPTTCCTDADCGTFGPCQVILSCSFGPGFNMCASSSGCTTAAYDQVDVPLTALPDQSNVFATFLASVAPSGGSSIAPALERMRTRAIVSANANPANRTAMVLVTDGNPTGCTANTVPDIANIATAARTGSPSIKTYVITIGIDPATMDPVAAAGGTVIYGVPTTATLDQATTYVRDSLYEIVADACK